MDISYWQLKEWYKDGEEKWQQEDKKWGIGRHSPMAYVITPEAVVANIVRLLNEDSNADQN